VVDDVEIRWPSGVVEHVKLRGVDRYYTVEEGKGIVPGVY
jgi:enediyne biosynthesis protein E4